MSDTEEDNARALTAWNAWKDVCWVHGLGQPRGNLPVVGTNEDAEILSKMIANAFRRKLAPFMRNFQSEDGTSSLIEVDFAQEFDAALHEYELSETSGHERYMRGHYGESDYVRKAKAWKDFVWKAVAESEDPPLKVIIGKLLGRLGVINQIVEDWLLANYSARFDGDMLVLDSSRDSFPCERPAEDCDDAKDFLEGVVSGAISPEPVEKNANEIVMQSSDKEEPIKVPKTWLDELEQTFSPRICCVMLAHINGVMLYKCKDILEAIGISKTTAAAELKRLREKSQEVLSNLDPELRGWLIGDDAGTRFFKKWIEKRCSSEKAGKLILSKIAMSEN